MAGRCAGEALATMELSRIRILLLTFGLSFDKHTTVEEKQGWLNALLTRWRAAEKSSSRSELAVLIDEIENKAFDEKHRVGWLRTRLNEARDDERSMAANLLFNHLLSIDWSAEQESEAFALIERIATVKEPNARVAQILPLLQRWVAAMVSQRIAHHQRQYPDFDKLPTRQQHHAAGQAPAPHRPQGPQALHCHGLAPASFTPGSSTPARAIEDKSAREPDSGLASHSA